MAVTSLLLWTATGCRTDLEPAPSADTVAGLEGAAVTRIDGVRVVAQADEWPGPVDVKDEVTPVRVRIENQGSGTVRVRYDQFALIGTQGRRFSALPPFEIEGEVAWAIGDPYFGYDGYALAPYHGGYYPGMTVWGGTFAYDPYYYSTYYPRWVEVELPTKPMLRYALPEGVLQPGGSVDGYLYFEKVPDDAGEVVFRADLVNADTNNVYGEARIPFVVE